MTHDKLLTLLKDYASKAGLRMDRNCWLILSDVVELHKPDSIGSCNACEQWTNEGPYQIAYPCPTIQAIKKEL